MKDKSNKQKLADHLRRLYKNKSIWDVYKMSNAEVIRQFKNYKKE